MELHGLLVRCQPVLSSRANALSSEQAVNRMIDCGVAACWTACHAVCWQFQYMCSMLIFGIAVWHMCLQVRRVMVRRLKKDVLKQLPPKRRQVCGSCRWQRGFERVPCCRVPHTQRKQQHVHGPAAKAASCLDGLAAPVLCLLTGDPAASPAGSSLA